MAATAPFVSQPSEAAAMSQSHPPQKLTTSIKALAELPGLSTVPSIYTFPTDPNDQAILSDTEESIPTIDFSLLTSSIPDERSKTIQELGKACQDWGFFMVY